MARRWPRKPRRGCAPARLCSTATLDGCSTPTTRTGDIGGQDEGRGAPAIPARPGTREGIPASVWVLGFVSMLMDISSGMIPALLPAYLGPVLGTSAFAVGTIGGVSEETASITKVFSGALSDWL